MKPRGARIVAVPTLLAPTLWVPILVALAVSPGCDARADFRSAASGAAGTANAGTGAAGAGTGAASTAGAAGQGPTLETLTIRAGGVYSGSWGSTLIDVPAVSVETTEPVVLEDCRIRGVGVGVRATGGGARLTIRGCELEALEPPVLGDRKPDVVEVANPAELVVEQNRFVGCGAVRTSNSDPPPGQIVRVIQNRFWNVDGRVRDATGGARVETLAGGTAIVVSGAQGGTVEIAWNEVINEPDASNMFNGIVIHESRGTALQPISIHDNYLQGGYASDPAADVAFGGAMMRIGNSPTASDVGYVEVIRNQIISFEHAGVSVDGGHDQRVTQNRILSAGSLADGRVLGGQYRNGMTLWDEFGAEGKGYFHHNELRGNLVWVVDRDGAPAPGYFPSVCATCVVDANTSPSSSPPTHDDEAAERTVWQGKLADAGIILP